MSILLLTDSINSKLTCNASECLSWIIVLFNILAVFYLAFCAWYKITKIVKLIGFISAIINLSSTVIIVFLHTCIFTLISAVFTGLITMALLSIVFERKINKDNDLVLEDIDKISGFYVIYNTTDSKYAFRLYDKSKKVYMSSCYKYNSLEEVKKAVMLSRKFGVDISLEDNTLEWVKALNVPKFVLLEVKNKMKYYFEYVISEELTILRSETYSDIVLCSKCVKKLMDAILTNEIFIAKEVLDGNDFKEKENKKYDNDNIPSLSTLTPGDKTYISHVSLPIENEDTTKDDNTISLNKKVRYTFIEQLQMSDKEVQDLYYEIKSYCLNKAKVKESDTMYKVKFKWSRLEIIHLYFIENILECGVMTGSSELKRMLLDKVDKTIKEKPTKIKLQNKESLENVKALIDIAYSNIEDARKHK